MDGARWVNTSNPQSNLICALCVCGVKVFGLGEEGGDAAPEENLHLIPKTRGHVCVSIYFFKDDIRKDCIAWRSSFSPNPHKEKNNRKRCSHNFMHDRTFCLSKMVAKRGCRGDNICGLRYGAMWDSSAWWEEIH